MWILFTFPKTENIICQKNWCEIFSTKDIKNDFYLNLHQILHFFMPNLLVYLILGSMLNLPYYKTPLKLHQPLLHVIYPSSFTNIPFWTKIEFLNVLFHNKQPRNYCKRQGQSGGAVSSEVSSWQNLGKSSGGKVPEKNFFYLLEGK